MSVRAVVTSTEVQTRSGTAKGSGRAYSIRQQPVLIELPNGERRAHNLSLDEGAEALKVGTYEPAGSAFQFKGYDLRISDRARDWKSAPAAKAT